MRLSSMSAVLVCSLLTLSAALPIASLAQAPPAAAVPCSKSTGLHQWVPWSSFAMAPAPSACFSAPSPSQSADGAWHVRIDWTISNIPASGLYDTVIAIASRNADGGWTMEPAFARIDATVGTITLDVDPTGVPNGEFAFCEALARPGIEPTRPPPPTAAAAVIRLITPAKPTPTPPTP